MGSRCSVETDDRTSLEGAYGDVGPGYCTKAGGPRVQTVLCDDSGAAGKGRCAYTQEACAALCTADSHCTGYMTQNMSIYQEPPTCVLVTPNAPSGAQWVVQNAGGGFSIGAHDGETRDHCYRKNGIPGQTRAPRPRLRAPRCAPLTRSASSCPACTRCRTRAGW